MALWMGLMEIAQQAGLVAKLTRGISPVLDFLFPRIPKGHKAREYIATNIIANVLGLGWACTPAGLKAMEELARLEQERAIPSIWRAYVRQLKAEREMRDAQAAQRREGTEMREIFGSREAHRGKQTEKDGRARGREPGDVQPAGRCVHSLF